MKTNKGIASILILIIAAIAIGGGAYFYHVTRPVETPKEDINLQTVPIVEENTGTTPTETSGEVVAAVSATFRIDQSASKATFTIDEDLRGKPFTVIGDTNQIAGELKVTENADGTSAISVGEIKVDARTFKTDSSQRDGAIVRMILKSETAGNEYIMFKPTKTEFVVSSLTKGAASFSVPGTLTISGVSKPVVFSVTNGVVASGVLSGDITATVKRSDFGLTIPNIPFVANVPDSFKLSGHIVAK